MENGFISLDRKIIDWEWYKVRNTFHFFLHLLLTVNWEDTRFRGIEVRRGSRVCDLPSLAEESGLSIQSIRTAIKHLKSTGEITDKITNKFRIVTVTKYNEYQDPNRRANRQLTDNQQTTNRQESAAYKERARRTIKQEEQYNNFIDNSPSENERAQEPDELKKEKLPLSDSLVAPPVPAAPPLQYGNEEINSMLLALKGKIGIDSFADGQKWERIYGKHCVTLLHKLGKNEFVRRLESLLEDSFHQKNCNRIKYVYNQIHGFIEPKSPKGKTVFIP